MAWTTPSSWGSGSSIAYSDMNRIEANIEALQLHFSFVNPTNAAVSPSTYHTISGPAVKVADGESIVVHSLGGNAVHNYSGHGQYLSIFAGVSGYPGSYVTTTDMRTPIIGANHTVYTNSSGSTTVVRLMLGCYNNDTSSRTIYASDCLFVQYHVGA